MDLRRSFEAGNDSAVRQLMLANNETQRKDNRRADLTYEEVSDWLSLETLDPIFFLTVVEKGL